jgi:hypothetical protein
MDESTLRIFSLISVGAIVGAGAGIAICESGLFNDPALVLSISSFLGANAGFAAGLILRKRQGRGHQPAPKLSRAISTIALVAGALLLVFAGARENSWTYVFWGLLAAFASLLPTAVGSKPLQERLIGAAMGTLSIVAFLVTREFSWLIIAAIAYFTAYAISSRPPSQKNMV